MCDRPAVARLLCRRCYRIARDTGWLEDFERPTMSADEALDDWILLRSEGFTLARAAERLGVSKDALHKHIARGKLRGDERAKSHMYGVNEK